MKNKKIIIIFLFLLIVILVGGYFGIKYVKNKKEKTQIEEYIPEEEITEEQLRQTIVSLYFPNKETNEINPEARLIDINKIINTPYEELINLLMEGPKNEKNKKIIPENTKVEKVYLENDCLVIDFSKEFLNYNKEEKDIMIKCIVNTLTELTEVNKIKILIHNEQNEEFKEIYEREKK